MSLKNPFSFVTFQQVVYFLKIEMQKIMITKINLCDPDTSQYLNQHTLMCEKYGAFQASHVTK